MSVRYTRADSCKRGFSFAPSNSSCMCNRTVTAKTKKTVSSAERISSESNALQTAVVGFIAYG